MKQFPCPACGGELRFEPGTDSLVCPFCETEVAITPDDRPIIELDIQQYLSQAAQERERYEVLTVQCGRCNAQTTFDPHITADECPFCGTALVRTEQSQQLIKPQAVIPFQIPHPEARHQFDEWLGSLWFAPNGLKKHAETETGLQGVYIPYWTFDASTKTRYKGQKGEYYYVTESYTTTRNGKKVREKREVRKTRWHKTKGKVKNQFDDIPVVASHSLPRAYVNALEPWNFEQLVPYDDQYLSGFRSESYQVNLEAGLQVAQAEMELMIETTIRDDIGGDEQRIDDKAIKYFDVTFKHVLLPIWISAYRYNDDVYRFIINAQTGEVQGERPYSWLKIALAIIAGLIVLFIVFTVLGIITLPIAPAAWPILFLCLVLILVGIGGYFTYSWYKQSQA